MAASAGSINYYAVLGVSSSATAEEIRAAYRKLAMQWHPDRVGEEALQQAYKVLSDPLMRELYDVGLYDPSDADDVFNFLVQEKDKDIEELDVVMEAMLNEEDKDKVEPRLNSDIKINLNLNVGSSSSSSLRALRVDVTFNDDGGSSSPGPVSGASRGGGGSGAGRRAEPFFSRGQPPRRTCPAPTLSAKLRFE